MTATSPPPAPSQDTAHLLVSCPDQCGIIAAVSGLLREQGINIIQSDQYSTDPEGGSFYLRMVLHVPERRGAAVRASGCLRRRRGRALRHAFLAA